MAMGERIGWMVAGCAVACSAVEMAPESRAAAALQRQSEQAAQRGGAQPPRLTKRALYLGSDDVVRAGGPANPRGPGADDPWQPRVFPTELAPEGLPVWLDLPEGVDLRRVDDGVELVRGAQFGLRVSAGVYDLAERKRALDNDRLQPITRYLVNQPDAVLYEVPANVVEPGVTEYHVLVVRTLAGRTYRCEDIRGPRYSRAQAEALLATCLSLRAR